MKRLLVFLSLLCVSGLQTANSDAFERVIAAMDAENAGAPAPDAQEAAPAAASAGKDKPVPINITSSDGQVLYVSDARKFEALNNLVEYLENADPMKTPIPVQGYNSHILKHAFDLYDDPNYQLPVTEEELKKENITLENLLKALNFLGAERYLEKFYIAWLNYPDNINKPIYRRESSKTIMQQLNIKGLDDVLSRLDITITENDMRQIQGKRTKLISIQYLIDTNRIPAILLQSLDLRHNKISSLYGLQKIPGIDTVKNLSLDNNQIATIERGAFEGLTNLKHLYLYNNQIATIKPGAFEGLTNLTNLWLDNNQIATIKPGAFEGLTNLRNLWINNNFLTTIKRGDFNGLNNLTTLNLPNNQLTTIKPGAFEGLTNLTKLYLHNNSLSKEQKQAIQQMVPPECRVNF